MPILGIPIDRLIRCAYSFVGMGTTATEGVMKLTKRASEYTSEERRALLAEMTGRFLAKFTPSMGDKYSAKQIDRAKGLAWSQMRAAGF